MRQPFFLGEISELYKTVLDDAFSTEKLEKSVEIRSSNTCFYTEKAKTCRNRRINRMFLHALLIEIKGKDCTAAGDYRAAGCKSEQKTERKAVGPYPDQRALGFRICRRNYKPRESSS